MLKGCLAVLSRMGIQSSMSLALSPILVFQSSKITLMAFSAWYTTFSEYSCSPLLIRTSRDRLSLSSSVRRVPAFSTQLVIKLASRASSVSK